MNIRSIMTPVRKLKRLTRKSPRRKFIAASLIILALGFIIGAIFGFLYITGQIGESNKATVVITLNYENSSNGLNPDDSKLNLRFLKGEEVLSKALETTEMNRYMTVKELASYIHIKSVSSKDIDVNAETKYIDSTYKVTLTLPNEYLDYVSAKKMLGEICESYQEWFIDSYVINSKALEIDTSNFDNMDYVTISKYFDLMALRGKNYLTQKEESTTAFIGSDGTTWKSLHQELSNLTEYDIATFNRYIWETGISRDKDWAITLYEYTNDELYIDYNLYIRNIDSYEKVVNQYRNEMTSSVLIPTYDEQGEFYMSRTKTGIDQISKSMDNYIGDASVIKEKIDLNSNKIDKLTNSKITNTEKADMMLKNIQDKIVDIFERIKALDTEYINKKTTGYIRYEFVEQS